MSNKVFTIIPPTAKPVPIVLSVPHCGIAFPDEIRDDYDQDLIAAPDDTDWFVDRLYDFAPSMGITMIVSYYSRWVIDLNRDPDSKPLYDDGRAITGLTPDKSFAKELLYKSNVPDQAEINRRLTDYYWPYHHKIQSLLESTRNEFGQALLFDAHSIRREVPSIYDQPFPDLILGDNDETSAESSLIQTAWKVLESSPFQPLHNTLFKGGHITRSFGKPKTNIHALQLEMCKNLYMDDGETEYHQERAVFMQKMLKRLFEGLINDLKKD